MVELHVVGGLRCKRAELASLVGQLVQQRVQSALKLFATGAAADAFVALRVRSSRATTASDPHSMQRMSVHPARMRRRYTQINSLARALT